MTITKIILACFLLPTLLIGCKSTQTPYEIDRQVNYQPKRPSSYYDFGVTEEKVNDRIYYITTKLEGTSSMQRAKDMWLLHAANVALKNNYPKFTTEKKGGGRWCAGVHSRTTGQSTAEDGGPKAKGFVLLIKDKSEAKKGQRVYDAARIKKDVEAKVNALIDDATMSQNSDRFLASCRGN